MIYSSYFSLSILSRWKTSLQSTLVSELGHDYSFYLLTIPLEPVAIGIIGGTGLSSLPSPPFKPLAFIPPSDTPWGKPSSPIAILSYTPEKFTSRPATSSEGIIQIADPPQTTQSSSSTSRPAKPITVAFLSRHGLHHEIAPHEVNSRANVAALRKLGVRCCIGFSAVGSLKEEVKPRDFLVADQVIDWTRGVRPWTFFEGGMVGHVSFAQPFDPELSAIVTSALLNPGTLEGTGMSAHASGTVICIEGPQFSSKAESSLYRSWGASVINMSAVPESKLMREAEIAYALVCMSTDYDCWRVGEGEGDVSVEMVMGHMKANSGNARQAVASVLGELSREGREGVVEGRRWKGSVRMSACTGREGWGKEAKERLEWLFPGEYD